MTYVHDVTSKSSLFSVRELCPERIVRFARAGQLRKSPCSAGRSSKMPWSSCKLQWRSRPTAHSPVDQWWTPRQWPRLDRLWSKTVQPWPQTLAASVCNFVTCQSLPLNTRTDWPPWSLHTSHVLHAVGPIPRFGSGNTSVNGPPSSLYVIN